MKKNKIKKSKYIEERAILLKQIDKLKKELNIDWYWERLLCETNLKVLLNALQDKKDGKNVNCKELNWA